MPNGREDPQTQSWHVDRRVPIALITAIMIQSGGAIWWAATTTGRLSAIETLVNSSMNNRLNRIEDKLDRLIENGIPARRLPGAP